MKLPARVGLALIVSVSAAQAQELRSRPQNYNDILATIQNSSWHGTFRSVGPGIATCYGSLDVKFFPMRKEPFSGGAQTVSYRHHAHFSPLNPFFPFCQTIGTSLSAVNVSGCESGVLKKATVENGQKVMVPVRTLIARNGGSSVVVSTPSCVRENGRDVVKRLEFTVKDLELTDSRKRNALKMTLVLDAAGLPLIVSHYELERVGRQ